MNRFARSLQAALPVNPFPGLVALEARLGHAITTRIGSNEGPPISNPVIRQRFGEQFAELARLYPDPSALALRELMAKQQNVPLDNILFDAGADSLILLSLRCACDAGDTVLTSAGTYPTFRYFAEGIGARVVELGYDDLQSIDQSGQLRPDLAGLAARAHSEQAKLVYLANPDNPTGYYHDRAVIRDFRQQLPADTVLILDEAYGDFAPLDDSDPVSASVNASTEYRNTVRLRTLSKAYAAAGLRLGYALADADWVRVANSVRIHYAISHVAQAAGAVLLADLSYKRQLIDETIALRQQLSERLTATCAVGAMPRVLASATNFVAIRYASAEHAAAIQQRLWQLQVAVHRPPHPALQSLLRVTAHPQALTDEIIQALVGR